MIHTEVGFSLKSELKNIVLTQKLVLFLNKDSKKNSAYTKVSSTTWDKSMQGQTGQTHSQLIKTFIQT